MDGPSSVEGRDVDQHSAELPLGVSSTVFRSRGGLKDIPVCPKQIEPARIQAVGIAEREDSAIDFMDTPLSKHSRL